MFNRYYISKIYFIQCLENKLFLKQNIFFHELTDMERLDCKRKERWSKGEFFKKIFVKNENNIRTGCVDL